MSIPIQPARRVPLADRAVVASKRGLPWWGAVLVAFAMTGVGIAIDLTFGNTLTAIFLACYVAGCLAAVLAVAHRGLFAAMVQPPLILAITVPLVVRALGTSTKGGMKDEVITLALPLVNGFPTMALTTLATVGLGVARIVIQRRAYPRGTPERTEAAQAAYRPRGQVLRHRVGANAAKAAPSGKTVPSGKEMPTSAGLRPGPGPRRSV